MSHNTDVIQLEQIKTKYQDLCRELNMDKKTEESSWDSYVEVSQKIFLDGDPYHWFCCSLYTACRGSFTPTVGATNTVVRGNCVSLTKLLRRCNISIYDFFTKIKHWSEMANLPKRVISQVDRLEHSFSITFHLFQKYNNIFYQIFVISPNEKKNKKSRPVKCSASKLYDLCWCLFLCAKNEDFKYTVDIVTSFHLLLCCIDLVFKNALAENRIDLINPIFEGVPEKWNTPEFIPSTAVSHCIIKPLSNMTQAISSEVLTMKYSSWKAIMTEFIKTQTVYCSSETFMDIISITHFETNLKSLNSAYEQYVLSVGEFDGRIFLNNSNYRKLSNSVDTDAEKERHHVQINQNDPLLITETLTARKEIISKPVTNASQSIKMLQDIADITEPSEYLMQAGGSTTKKLEDKLISMSAVFFKNFPTQTESGLYFQLATSLYFYLLEKIIRVEIRSKPNLDLKVLLETDSFNTTLIACCVEIVLDVHNSQLKFPWILNCFGVKAFQFYKIIEIVVGRHDGVLTRSLIKHLNSVEEICLESLAWRNCSPLWDVLKQRESPLPSWADVDVKNSSESTSNIQRNLLQSPMNSAYDCFSSTTTTSDSARRDLFNAGKCAESMERKDNDTPKYSQDRLKRAGSLLIFLRKFFKLAWLRIKELCKDLDMGDEKYLNKIWTLFEYSITQRSELMKDRHLDQILMCAIYLYIKVGEIQGKSFTDIMKFYRKQPQAASNTYREVLIETKKTVEGSECKARYGDIIYFYNNIYVQKMTPYALNFSDKKKSQHDLLLSPHPAEKVSIPKKLSNSHFLYIHPLEKNEVLHSPNHITYEFCKSPAKDLDKINDLVRNGKRNLPFDETALSKKVSKTAPYYFGKIQGIIKDRQEERTE